MVYACSAGGMALSTLVPATVNSISLLAKSSNVFLQSWSLHGLFLTIKATGLSFVSHVQVILAIKIFKFMLGVFLFFVCMGVASPLVFLAFVNTNVP